MANVKEEIKVFAVQKDNIYHTNLLNKFIDENKLKIIDVSCDEKSLKKYTQNALQIEKELLRIEIPETMFNIDEYISKLKLKKRYVALIISKPKQLKTIKELIIDNSPIQIYPPVNTWKEKYDFNYTLIENLDIHNLFESLDLIDLLVRLLVKSPESWNEIELILTMAKERQQKITKEYLQVYFPNVEFHNFNEFVFQALRGKHKKKTIAIANYFLDVKQYSPNWMVKQFRDKTVDLAVVYQAYRKGIIHLDVEPSSKLLKRANVLNWSGGQKLADMKYTQIKQCLKFIQDIPYNQFVGIEKVLFDTKTSEKYNTKAEFYGLLEELRLVQEKYKKENPKPYRRRGKNARRK